jgi:outer membrane protein OmpA-like peptidoglycan-associated protein
MNGRFVAVALLVLPLFAACGSSSNTRRYDDVLAKNDRYVEVDAADEAVNACGFDSARTYFSKDSSELSKEDRAVIDEVAYCLNKGRFAGRSILVTGYTDDLGTTVDNKELGWLRAEAVANELNLKGVPANHIFVHSTGERLAMGNNEGERAFERRVELRLIGVHEL